MKTIIFFILVVLIVANPITNRMTSGALNLLGNSIHWVADQVEGVRNEEAQ